jgi:hypothetical protein
VRASDTASRIHKDHGAGREEVLERRYQPRHRTGVPGDGENEKEYVEFG